MEAVNEKFSPHTKELIGASREAALKLGFDYISTIHFLIADCEAGRPDSIMSQVFDNREALDNFKNSIRKNKFWNFGKKDTALPLTKEFEAALKSSVKIFFLYGGNAIQPAHIFFAALNDETSDLSKLFSSRPFLINQLFQYYLVNGMIRHAPVVEEDPVADKMQYEKVQLEITSLSESNTKKNIFAVVLSTVPSKRKLPIVVGKEEIRDMAVALEKMQVSRPMTHHLLYAAITATQYHVVEVHINRLVNEVFHAKVIISNNSQQHILDARPSDALTLATIAGVPIYTSTAILEKAGIEEQTG